MPPNWRLCRIYFSGEPQPPTQKVTPSPGQGTPGWNGGTPQLGTTRAGGADKWTLRWGYGQVLCRYGQRQGRFSRLAQCCWRWELMGRDVSCAVCWVRGDEMKRYLWEASMSTSGFSVNSFYRGFQLDATFWGLARTLLFQSLQNQLWSSRKKSKVRWCLKIPAELSPHLQCTYASQQDSHMGTNALGSFLWEVSVCLLCQEGEFSLSGSSLIRIWTPHLVLKAGGMFQRLSRGSERVTSGAEQQLQVMK